MNEISFIHKNRKIWDKFEKMMDDSSGTVPDEISDLFIRLTDDLAYARTYFPESRITGYLNHLAQKAYSIIYRNKPVKKSRINQFWKYSFPVLMYEQRKQLLYSFILFFIATTVGILSTVYETGFERVILGDRYINMTLENIKNGDPMAVYKSMKNVDMFLGITMNNIYVSFLAFLFGILTPAGTGYILIQNGIMLGTFHAFLAKHGILFESVSTIWIHGTFEIFSIVVAGAAGFTMGNSIVFPGTFSRIRSFRNGARKGAKMIFGLIPFFIVAGFLEGFVTRHTGLSFLTKFTIIGLSLIIILLYFFIYPNTLIKQNVWKIVLL